MNREYFDQFMGILPGRGKAIRALLEERRKEREREDKRTQ